MMCSVDGCDKRSIARALCTKHYQRWMIKGSTADRDRIKTCTEPGCDRPHYARGVCTKHRARNARLERGVGPRQQPARDFLLSALEMETDVCIRWPFATNAGGYGNVEWEGKKQPAHRVICALAHGEPPFPEAQAAHARECPHRDCINKRHLRWATAKENTDDRAALGRVVRGEKMHFSKLTEAQVLAIYSDERIAREIAAEYGCSVKTVESIWQGVHWGWLTQPEKAKSAA